MKNQPGVLAQRMELDFWPLLLRNIDLDCIAGEEGRRTDGIVRHPV